MSPKKPLAWPSINSVILFIDLVLMSMQFCASTSIISPASTSKPECYALQRLLLTSINGSLSTNCNCTPNNGTATPALMTWIHDNHCKNCSSASHYPRVRCTGNGTVTELHLSNVTVPQESLNIIATAFKNLKILDLSSNNITGNIPSSLWALEKLTYLNLSSNKLINFSLTPSNPGYPPLTPINHSLIPTNHPLKILDLANNRLRIPFPLDLCSGFPNLTKLILSSNSLRGPSVNLSLCHQLERFDVSSNKLTGNFGSLNFKLPLNLSKFNVSHNNLVVGFTSNVISKFGLSSFWPNKVCKECFKMPHVNAMASASPSPSPSHYALIARASHSHHASIMKSRAALTVGIVMGGTVLVLIMSSMLCLVILIKRRHKKELWPPCKAHIPPFKHVSVELGPFSFESQSGTWVADVKDPSNVPLVIFHKPLLNLTFANLIEATGSFNRESEVGDGTGLIYTCVLPGVLDNEGAKVAIKVVEDGHSLSRKDAEHAFREMGEMVKHENLVPLLGYCIVGEEKLLIYKHMEEGSLEDFLHGAPETGALFLPEATSPLQPGEDWHNIETWPEVNHPAAGACMPGIISNSKKNRADWEIRLKIGLGVARVLAYLHYGGRRPIIHGAVSSSCVLLDRGYVAKLANYGGGWGLSRRMTTGFVAPECAQQSTASTKVMAFTAKCDVYSMGVVLLELVTGLRAVGDYRGFTTLVAWVRMLMREKKAECSIDPQLPSSAHPQALEVIKMGYLCTADSASKRPSIQQVVGLLKDLVSLT